MPAPPSNKAVFFDRDGTLIEDPGFLRDPAGVTLLPGVADSIRRLRAAGYRILVASNQSGLARGYITKQTYEAINARLAELLTGHDAAIDAFYHCPYLPGPEAVVEKYRRESDWRKPAPGMFLQAIADHQLDPARCWAIGDSDRDTIAAKAAGCRTIQLRRPDSPPIQSDPDHIAASLAEATDLILAR